MDLTMLVNALHPLPIEWEPDDLVDLWKVQPRHFHLFPRQTRLVACAADAANALFEHAEIPAEPWHLRYVGREVALEMRNRGWVLEEWCEAHGRIGHDPLAELERDYFKRWANMEMREAGVVVTRRMLYDNRSETNAACYAPLVDYVRYREIELLAEELKRASVSGAVAEVGVELGYTSAVLNRIFSDSKLYLYDSFDGFEDAAIAEENKRFELPLDFSDRRRAYRPEPDVSRQLVLRRLPYKENAVIRQGLFPETAILNDSDVVFAFVVLDVDLYKTTLEGIEFFWPRLANGGYLMIHDYNTDHLKGIHDAVADAEKKFGRFIRVPIPDAGGSLVIQKPFV